MPMLPIRFRSMLLIATLAVLLAAPVTQATPGDRSSAATITGSFADSCRDFAARSNKDILHVELHYADGRVAKDETIDSSAVATDGGAGDEIEFAIVKSGTARKTFACSRENSPPTAILEIKTPGCAAVADGTLLCDATTPRTAWQRSSIGFVRFSCPITGSDDDSICLSTFGFRGASSTDPDND